jgi:hypothetical protein
MHPFYKCKTRLIDVEFFVVEHGNILSRIICDYEHDYEHEDEEAKFPGNFSTNTRISSRIRR